MSKNITKKQVRLLISGHGSVPIELMKDTNLTIIAKGIYTFIACHQHEKELLTEFYIMDKLGITEDELTSGLDNLVEEGYI